MRKILTHLRYLKYILKHKWYVFLECYKMGIVWRGITHDLSKLSRTEWTPYVKNFYGTKKEQKQIKDKYDCAWLKHIHKNSHHWQHWILREDDGDTKALPMPEKDIMEMVCDWRGAGRAITGKDNTFQWYTENKHKMMLHPNTKRLVEHYLHFVRRQRV